MTGDSQSHRLTITVNSDLQHKPVIIRVQVPERLAVSLQSMPITSINIMAERSPGMATGEIKLLDFG